MQQKFMDEALKEARKAYKKDEVPIGAIIVKDNEIISKAHNLVETKKDATMHAEIIAIERACRKLNTWHLDDCTLYVTVEPCLMCSGAMIQSRIDRVVYATKNEKFGYIESVEKIFENKNNHNVKITNGIYEKEAKELIQKFFKKRRK